MGSDNTLRARDDGPGNDAARRMKAALAQVHSEQRRRQRGGH